MLISLFRKCCCILWSHLSYQTHISWLFLLVLLCQQLQGSDGKPSKWNHSIQRRFMWKQMDSTVDGFVDRVVTGARVMKSMIGEFMPPKAITGNAMDYLPTETTRIKYIIRNPHTKETKVIRVRPSKKVVKLMAMTPKPLLPFSDKPKHMYEPQQMSDKMKPISLKENEYTTKNVKSFHMMAPDKLRQLEKEQELIAEGRIPIRSETRPTYMAFKSEKPKYDGNYFNVDDSIVSGKIQEINASWKPVYKLGDPPAGFTTSKPYMMSALHTSVVGELLPEPQKQVYEPLTSNHFPEEEPTKSHTYEVTEYTAEESVVQPYTHEYNKHESQTFDLHSAQTAESSLKHDTVSTEIPKAVADVDNDHDYKTYRTEIRSQRGLLPTRGNYRLIEETTTTTSSPTTTEEPNYPAIFLKKIRSRPEINNNFKVQQRAKLPEIAIENNWIPSNLSSPSQRSRQIPYHLTSVSSSPRTKSQKWPPDVENTYFDSEPLPAYDISTTTEVPIVQEFTTQIVLNKSNSRKNVRLKSPPFSSLTAAKHTSVRLRGSVKYGDKLEIEER